MDETAGSETEVKTQTLISEVKPIEQNRNLMLTERGEVRAYVEPPLVKACERYWDMNVRTLSSSANTKDVNYGAHVILDYDSLSEVNKKVAEEEGELLKDYDGRPAINLEIPIDEKTTAKEIERQSYASASRFQKQKATWIMSMTLGEIRQMYGIDPEDDEFGVDGFKEEGYYYDQETRKFYLSKELYHKAVEEV